MRMRVWAPPWAPTPARRKSHSCRWGILIRNRPPAVMKRLVHWPDRLRGTGDAIGLLWPTVPIQHAKGSKRPLDTRPKPLKPRFHSGLRNQCGLWLEARLQGRYTLFLGHIPELCDVIAGGNAHIEQKRTRCSMALLARADRNRRAVVHALDQVILNDFLARRILPHAAGMAVYDLLPSRARREAMNVRPLLDDLRRIHSRNGQVACPVPD